MIGRSIARTAQRKLDELAAQGLRPGKRLLLVGNGVVGANLSDDGRRLSTFDDGSLVLGQSWVDERSLLLDLLAPDRNARIARLRVGMAGRLERRELTGWLEYAGRRWRTVCAPD